MAHPTVQIARLDGSPDLRVENADRLAQLFFALDASSRGAASYDAWVATARRDRIMREDVHAINVTMRARSGYKFWDELLDRPLPWLDALGLEWDLFQTSDILWKRRNCDELLDSALSGILAKGRGISVATKMLHIKRPRLFPVLDSYVVETIGGTPKTPNIELLRHVRREGRRNLAEMERIQAYLAERGVRRSLVRIMDALLWTSYPKSAYYPMRELLNEWSK